MRRVLWALVALWQIEMAVQCGIATSQRPTAARPVKPPAPTPPDARSVLVNPQPQLQKCENGRCTMPPVQHPPVIIRSR